MHIRKAELKDLKEIQKLNFELCKKEFSEFDSAINPNFPLEKEGYNYFKEKITSKDSFSFVAFDENKIIGYLAGSIIKSENYRNIKKMAEAENMFILEEYRSKRIGTNLMREFFKWCKKRDVERIKSVISVKNRKSLDFHKKNGFEDYNIVLEKKI